MALIVSMLLIILCKEYNDKALKNCQGKGYLDGNNCCTFGLSYFVLTINILDRGEKLS